MKKQLFITGGLGNQMFEYAFYLSCRKKGIDLSLNIDMYNVNRMHNGYMLGRAFGIDDKDMLATTQYSTFISRAVLRQQLLPLVYQEEIFKYSENVFYTRRPYIRCTFINEKYFKSISDDVRKTYTFANIDTRNNAFAQVMNNEESVSLHIRRGDYLLYPQYEICDEQYFRKAIDYINSHVVSPKYYVFSDDPNWCVELMENIGVQYEIILHNRGMDSYKDMYLMTQCRHNIIVNSTFSWWGAWLNSNQDKIVICPSVWIKGTVDTPIVEGWTIIAM